MSYKINKEKTIDRLRELDSTFPLELKKILEEKHDLPAELEKIVDKMEHFQLRLTIYNNYEESIYDFFITHVEGYSYLTHAQLFVSKRRGYTWELTGGTDRVRGEKSVRNLKDMFFNRLEDISNKNPSAKWKFKTRAELMKPTS
tara:strand:+ start:2036 stop:2467 length:432 start_codon:yes stop_codon:yes gene_type:complete